MFVAAANRCAAASHALDLRHRWRPTAGGTKRILCDDLQRKYKQAGSIFSPIVNKNSRRVTG